MTAPAGIEVDLWRDVRLGAVRDVYQFFRVALAGAVFSFARETTRATLRLMVNAVGTDLKVRAEPNAVDIPVIMPGGGGYTFAFDMRQDDPAVVVCCDGPVRGYYETGGAVTPTIGQSHDFGCAVCLPGGRISATDTPTAPPNNAGEAVLGAVDGSAALILRGAGLPTPTETGTVIIAAAGPTASVLLGGIAATLGVARLADEVAPTADLATAFAAMAGVINGLAPGTVTPAQLVSIALQIGTISTASEKVVSE
jgi:hypothetical protein